MGVLEQVINMQNQGIPEDEIVRNLQEQGVPPREITNALNQAQIKNAVSEEPMQENMEIPPEGYSPYPPAEPGYAQYGAQEFYPQAGYQGYEQSDTSTMIEVAEQVFSEKVKKLQTQVEELTDFRILSQSEITNISDRLQRIETTIDKLQLAILEKIGSYGNNLESIKKEMSMIEDSFSKVVEKRVREKSSKSKK